jgi:hypothetical protein
VRGNLIYRSGPGYHGYYMDAQPDQSLLLRLSGPSHARSALSRESRPQRFTRAGPDG